MEGEKWGGCSGGLCLGQVVPPIPRSGKGPPPPQAEGGVLTAGMALALRREAWPVAAENSG